MWSRNKANLYIQDALVDFEPDFKNRLCSPPAQYRMYRDKLILTHLVGFGGAAGGIVGTSYLFNGLGKDTEPTVQGEYLLLADHSDWDFGAGEITAEAWCYNDSAGTAKNPIFCQAADDSNRHEFYATNTYKFKMIESSVEKVSFETGSRPPTDVWVHIAFERSGNIWTAFENGVIEGTPQTVSTTLGALSAPVYIGKEPSQAGAGAYITGQMDEIRVSDTARYGGSDFTPHTVPHSSDANTLLLINCTEALTGTSGSGATFTDSGNTGHTVTEIGGAIRTSTNAKFAD